MEDRELDLLQKIQYLKQKTLTDFSEELTSEKISEKFYNNEAVERKNIEKEVNELMKDVIIEIRTLGNIEENEKGFYEIIINGESAIYYDTNLEKIAQRNGEDWIVEQDRDKPEIIEQIQDLIIKEDLSLEEIEKVKKVAEENGIDEMKDSVEEKERENEKEDEIEEHENSEDEPEIITKTKMDELKGYTLQELDLSQIIDGRESLAKRLDLQEYSKIYVVYSNNVKKVSDENGKTDKINNTRYSLIGIRNDDKRAEVLTGKNGKFEIDKTSGINPDDESIRQNDDNTTEKSNDILTRYRRVDSGETISLRQDEQTGYVRAYFEPGRTKEENMAIGTEIETAQTKRPYEGGMEFTTKRIMSKEHGIYNLDRIQDEVEGELQRDTDGKLNPEQADGKDIITTEYIEIYIENAVEELMNTGDIGKVFSENEVRNQLSNKIYLTSISKKEDLDKIKSEVEIEMDADALYLEAHGRVKS